MKKIFYIIKCKIKEKRLVLFNFFYQGLLFIPSLFNFFILLNIFFSDSKDNNLLKVYIQKGVTAILMILSLIVIIKSLINAIRSLIYSRKIEKNKYAVVDIDEHLILKCGMPGTCKTLTGINQALLTAERVWSELVSDYWELSSKTDSQFSKNTLLVKRYRQVKRGFEFWSSYEGIKCFASNIPIEYCGKFGLMLTREHLDQKEWLPPFTVCFVDEVGSFCTNKESMVNAKCYELEDNGRFSRHNEFWLIFTEQQPMNLTKSLRNVIGQNERMTGKTWILRPNFLIWICTKMQSFGVKKWFIGRYVRLYSFLNNWSKQLGYFVITSELMGNMEIDGMGSKLEKRIVTFSSFNFKYDSKCFSSLYLAKNFVCNATSWRSTSLPKNSAIARSIYSKYAKK